MELRRVVIKLGGAALFSGTDWISSLSQVLAGYSDACVLLLVGGGDIVEGVRNLHRKVPILDDELVHWECVQLLDSTFRIAAELLPLDGLIRDIHEIQSPNKTTKGAFWVRVAGFYSQDLVSAIPTERRPVHNWDTTTDALALFLGLQVAADEVVLIKSCALEPNMSLLMAADLGIVDSECVRLSNTFQGRVRLITTHGLAED